MADALIGYTGFVGGNLLNQRPFDELFNSRNIATIGDRAFDTIVCAGAPAEKWRANREPMEDRARLATLTEALERTSARKVILVSTVDVYPSPVEVDETTPIDPEGGQPYGRHRYELERFVQERFDTLVAGIILAFVHHTWGDRVTAWLVKPFHRALLGMMSLACLWLLVQPWMFGKEHVQMVHVFAWGTVTSIMYFGWLLLLIHGDTASWVHRALSARPLRPRPRRRVGRRMIRPAFR